MKLVEFTVKKGIETFRVAVDPEQVVVVGDLDIDNEKTRSPNRTTLGTTVGNLTVAESYDEVMRALNPPPPMKKQTNVGTWDCGGQG